MALDDMWEVRINQTYPGAGDVMNVFHVNALSTMTDATVVNEIVIGTLLPVWKGLVSNQLRFANVISMNLEDRFKVATTDVTNVVGEIAGEYLPKFMAYSFIVARETNDVRHGFKRFCGVSEDLLASGTLTPNGITRAASLSTFLVSSWNSVLDWHIVKRIKYTPPGKTTPRWRLPQTDAELKSYKVISAPFAGVTTQNTRKR